MEIKDSSNGQAKWLSKDATIGLLITLATTIAVIGGMNGWYGSKAQEHIIKGHDTYDKHEIASEKKFDRINLQLDRIENKIDKLAEK